MRTLNKEDIRNRFRSSNYKATTEILELEEPLLIKNCIFNKICKVIIPGLPIADSRPRHRQSPDGDIWVYNPHKANLMKVFNEIYSTSDTLKGLCILGPMYVQINMYKPIPKVYLPILSKYEKGLLKKECFMCFSTPDVDNIEKINYDVFQDDKYSIILRDEMVVSNNTNKIFVERPEDARVEINIYYNDNIPKWAKELTERTKEYLKFTLSMKYKFINNIPDENWGKVFYKNIISFYKRTKSKEILTSLEIVLNYYSKKDLDLIVKEKTREEAINRIKLNVESILIQLNTK